MTSNIMTLIYHDLKYNEILTLSVMVKNNCHNFRNLKYYGFHFYEHNCHVQTDL
jgi:hypothetical protein